MSSANSIKSAGNAESAEKDNFIWDYSANSESVVDASSSCGRSRGCEEASTSGREEARPSGREDRTGGHSPLADLFTYPSPILRQSRETGEFASSMRAARTDFEEGVGTSRPSRIGEASTANEQRLVIEVPHLRDESLSPAEPIAQVKIEEGNWEYNPLIQAERLDAWVGSGFAEVVKRKTKKSRRQQRPPPGSSWCDEKTLADLRLECGIPDSVEMIAPSDDQREDDPPVGTFTAYECWFRGCYLTFPIPKTILRYTLVHRISLAQINTRGVRQLVGLLREPLNVASPSGSVTFIIFSKSVRTKTRVARTSTTWRVDPCTRF